MADKRQSRADKGKARGSYKDKWGRERDAEGKGDWIRLLIDKATEIAVEALRNRGSRR